ncbi:uncharacterized protein CEXT_748741 [Caerostris extrusa]|uniref:Uncharacterized protein n=1 Tax=Caerostris extrusa TaxID=172846 RepID=A0AAV4NH48_CAEEX|nr:uncharacterized protein CEXT_748741 [Caerostris extrusa]
MMTSELSSKDVSENEFNGEKDDVGEILSDASIIVLASVKILQNEFQFNSILGYTEPEITENEYEVMYGNATDKLMFATNIMKFIRYFNQLKYVPIIYRRYAKLVCLPPSPCGETVDLAIKRIWGAVKNEVEMNYDLCCKSFEMNYQRFQVLTISIAREIEKAPYFDLYFLKNCVILCQLAACAEKNGVQRAVFFVPLILCRIMDFFRKDGHFPEDIWTSISKTAAELLMGNKMELDC